MSLDINSLLGTAPIGVAHEMFNYDQDGSEIGRHSFRGQPLPAGALLLGVAWYTTGAIASDVDGTYTASLPMATLEGPSPSQSTLVVEWGGANIGLPAAEDTWLTLTIETAVLLSARIEAFILYIVNPAITSDVN